MKNFPYLCLLFIGVCFRPIQGQCSGGIWPIQDPAIGSLTVSWRYNIASNTVQFILQGQAISSININSTYIALGWSNTAPTMNNMDVAMFFPGSQIVQDRFSRGHIAPSVDSQQDFCLILTNITGQNVYVAFERFISTGDANDISFLPNLYLMLSMGSYTLSADGTIFNPQFHFFRIALQTMINLLNCTSNACSTITCSTASCPCLQQITSGAGQCICFPPSSCISGSTITPRSTVSNTTTVLLIQTLPMTTLTNTNSCQCVNGGTCLSNGTCSCSNNYAGKFCQLSNPCIGYCLNNGTCSVLCTDISCGLPSCTCANGYSGQQCNMMVIGGCQPGTCVNGNCIIFANASSQCQCLNGFFGTRCDFINSCLSNPCNQGTCVVSSNCVGILCGYSCLCSNGITGTNCQNGANPCLSAPCRNNGSCTVSSNSYSCQCLRPYGGTNCDIMTNICTPNPCLNSGTCIGSSDMLTYQCQCPNGYIGARCEYLSGCISSPCRNNGQCISSTSNCSSTTCSATCLCLAGTTGVFCEQQGSSCLTSPCLNGGTCSLNQTTNSFFCRCPSNTTGVRCETSQLICTNTICSNHGICYVDASSGNTTLRCICIQGYTGQFCQSVINSINPCLLNPCGNTGICFPSSNASYYCLCPNGLLTQSCNTSSLLSCANTPCRYLSRCQSTTNANSAGYQCICPDYLVGDRCQYTNSCQKQPCFNQGTCVPLGPQNSFMCSCPPGFGQFDCSTNLGLICTSNVCLNGGTCVTNSTNLQCICPVGFAGARCEWTSVCSSNTCLNGGTCRQTAPTIVECLCANGFSGPTCSLHDSCVNFPCKNGGGCATLLTDTGTNWSAYRCTCPPGFYGQNCDIAISSCAAMTCPTFKICSEQPTGPVCTCSGSKVGTFCQYDNPCSISSSTYCLNGGTCVPTNTDPPSVSCLCPQGFTGLRCDVTLSNNPCASNPCQTHGFCALSATNTSYSCICNANYTGSQCERQNPCISSPCVNQGVCLSAWNTTNTWFTCLCIGTFTGTRCETSLINLCGGFCMNGSPCVNGTCACPAQYTGSFCGLNNPCYNPICRNGGVCSTNSNSISVSFICTCPGLYTGQFCEASVFNQLQSAAICPSACLNGGTCINGACTCTSQYIGLICQYQNPCVNGNRCLNSGTCFGQYSANGNIYTQCFCLQGYTGMYCEATLCSATSCNGGLCTAAQNTFVCLCPTGKFGDRCQYADVCMSNPCLPTERCDQAANRYRCVPCYDRSTFCSTYQNSSQYCNSRYSLLVNNTYLPVPDACQLSCNKCVSPNLVNEASPVVEVKNDDTATIMVEEYTTTIIVEEYTTDSTTTTTTTSTSSTTTTTTNFEQNMIFSREEKCFDRRDDCLMQKQYGFCEIFNAKYPYDCIQTCHPDCASYS